MFGNLGLSEILVIVVVGLIVLGPRRLPEMARTIGKAMIQLRRAANEARATIEREVELAEVRQTVGALRAPVEAVARAAAEPPPPYGRGPQRPIEGLEPGPAAAPPATPAVEPGDDRAAGPTEVGADGAGPSDPGPADRDGR
jgi:Tat protein translocase TatB subunit